MADLKMLAVDLGASSGRGIVGRYDGKKITLEENHRFRNDPVMVNDSFVWDILRIFFEIKNSIRKCALSGDKDIVSIGTDTWGVDFGLLDKYGKLIENPFNYRDKRTDDIYIEAYKRIPKDNLYAVNGSQYLKFNTIFQLLSVALDRPELLEYASDMLMTPDMLNYFLTGEKASEYTISSTTGLLDAKKRAWALDLLAPMGIPEKLLGKIVHPGNILGGLSASVLDDVGNISAKVVNVGSHDTASAIAAVPADGKDFVYISSGTWSLMGTESDEPIISAKSSEYDFTNEGGVCGTIRVLKNVMGLWLEQESKRQWEREGDTVTFDELSAMAEKVKPCTYFIDVDEPQFLPPGNIPDRIRDYCKATGQPVPQTKGEIVRCIFDSLGMKYKQTYNRINELRGMKIPFINVVGGGTKEEMLNQITADACGVPVFAGPVEATALGNLSAQLMSCGEIKNLEESRAIIRGSFEVQEYKPQNTAMWDDEYGKYLKITGNKI